MPRLKLYAAASVALLTPCFWQRRIQAGDLSSHVYNAWLADLIGQGKAHGLALVGQSHNVLFDVMLCALLRACGTGPAQRIAVSLAVLIFFWGAFALVWVISRRGPVEPPWSWTPCLAILAYGWVFHMGLFNFYLSLGLAFWALAAWMQGRRITGLALLPLAFVAHPLPVIWAVGAAAYLALADRLAPRGRAVLAVGSLAALALLGVLSKLLLQSQWAPGQALASTGADQIWVFGDRYIPLALVVLALWLVSLKGASLLDARLHLCLLNAAAIVLIPSVIVLPGTGQPESILLSRMSLAGAVLVGALAVISPMRKWMTAAMSVAAAVFFVFLYQDEGALNRVEDRMERVVAQLPPGQRVVSALMDTDLREFALLHVIDRACVGRCFSYANYEPSVGQFRVRAAPDNPIVVADFRDSWAMQAGGYVVKARDLPLYRVDLCGPDLCAAPVAAGVTLQRTWLHVTPELWR